jgi:hypothetical protein
MALLPKSNRTERVTGKSRLVADSEKTSEQKCANDLSTMARSSLRYRLQLK